MPRDLTVDSSLECPRRSCTARRFLVLHDDRACGHLVAVAHVPDFEGDEIASAQLAVDAQIEEREFASTAFHLEADAQCPDVLDLERRLLPDDLAFVPRLAMNGIACASHDGLPSSCGSRKMLLPGHREPIFGYAQTRPAR